MDDPIYYRSKCAIVQKGELAYLIGGLATEKKILTNHC
jgi:hypothetical protein